MSQREIKQDVPLAQSSSFRDLFKNLVPRHKDGQPREQLAENLERIALSAPHILADIGFERDPDACLSGKTVWRRGPLCVTISIAARSVSISRL